MPSNDDDLDGGPEEMEDEYEDELEEEEAAAAPVGGASGLKAAAPAPAGAAPPPTALVGAARAEFDAGEGEEDGEEGAEGAADAGVVAGADGDEEAEEEGEALPHSRYPDPPVRAKHLAELFALSGFSEIYQELNRIGVNNPLITGLQNDASRVEEGDLFFCLPLEVGSMEGDPLPADYALEAVQKGALAVVAGDDEVAEKLPAGFPLVMVSDVEEVQARMASVFYEAPSERLDVVGITGSYGKTTVGWLVRGVLEEAGGRVGMVGSLEWAIDEVYLDQEGGFWAPEGGEPDSTEGRDCSTPFHLAKYTGRYRPPAGKLDSLRSQKALAGIADRGGTSAVLEVHPLCVGQGKVDFVTCKVAVFTNMTPKDPIGATDGTEEYVACAARMFDFLVDPEQRAVVNLDDPHHMAILAAAADASVVGYSLTAGEAGEGRGGRKPDVWLESSVSSQWETEMLVVTPGGRLQIITPLLGRHNMSNVLAAVATGVALGVPLEQIVRGVEAVEVVPGRCEIIDEGQAFPVVVDAASTPEALATILDTVRESRRGRVFLVMGCPGDRDRGLRPYMGEVAHLKAEYVILTNDSPRTEDPHDIIQDIVAGFPEDVLNIGAGSAYWFLQDQGRCPLWFEPYLQSMQQQCHRYVMEDRWSAIRAAIGTASEGDVVLIVGRGAEEVVEHGDYEDQVVQGWFDDRVEARNALSRLPSLYQLTKLSRADLPWGNTLSEEFDTVVVT